MKFIFFLITLVFVAIISKSTPIVVYGIFLVQSILKFIHLIKYFIKSPISIVLIDFNAPKITNPRLLVHLIIFL